MVNIAIIGMGQRGRATLARLKDIPTVNVTHQCDQDTDWREVVSDSQVDLVWICTPWEWHLRMATLAMECGKDVALEVPAVGGAGDGAPGYARAYQAYGGCLCPYCA